MTTARSSSATRVSAADRVASILEAAEAAAEQIRSEAERRVTDRIAEGDRAAAFRVQAAEEEAAEILADARSHAERLTRDGRERDEQARTTATSEAVALLANARLEAKETLAQATEAATRSRQEAETYTRELLNDARLTANEVRTEGMELVDNLRQMGDSLRANAERLLRDVQSIHSQMVARIDRVEANGRLAPVARDSRPASSRSVTRDSFDAGGDLPDVPEFIPRG
jgi:vacuolar-type H+-ATPase subunit H